MILNFGSINVDMVMHVSKLPTPGDTVLCTDYQVLPGGKGANQAVSAASVGSEVIMFGKVGDDNFGHLCLKNFKNKGVETKYISFSEEPTGCASISVDQYAENIITVASGANKSLESSCVPEDLLKNKPLILMQMEVPFKENLSLLKRAKKYGCFTVLNLAPANAISQEALKNLDCLVMNEVEVRQLGKELKIPVSNLNALVEFLSKRFSLTAIITRGHKGILACTPEGSLWEFSAFPVEPLDTTGAGDNFVGVFSAMIDQERDMKTALSYAVVSSGLSCLVAGAQGVVSVEEIEKNLSLLPEPKLVNLSDLRSPMQMVRSPSSFLLS